MTLCEYINSAAPRRSQSRRHVRETTLQIRPQIAETAKTFTLQVIIARNPTRFDTRRSMDKIANRALGRQSAQAHLRESRISVAQRTFSMQSGIDGT